MSPLSTVPALLSILSLTSALPSLPLNARADSIPFDAAQQYVSNKGEHVFIAPGPDDQRSPCPALNVMANHGYLPRNGLVTLLDIQESLAEVFGISPDFAAVLSLFFVGSPPQGEYLSIAGFPDYLTGEGPYQFIAAYGIGTIDDQINPMQQLCTNYKAINGSQYRVKDPFSTAGGTISELHYRAFSNKSVEYPRGSLNGPTKLAMLAMTPKNDGSGTFTWNKFQNAIPDDWYKSNERAQFDTLTLVTDMFLLGDYGCSPDPRQFLAAYTGSEDTDVSSLTNGAYKNSDLQDTNNFNCFVAQAAPLILPALANTALFDNTTRLGVASAVKSIQQAAAVSLTCPIVLTSINLPLLSNLLGIQL